MLDQPVPNPVAKNPNIYTHKVFASIGLILIGTIIGVAGVWWYMGNQTDSSSDEANTTTTKVSTTSAKTDETADWKTYTSSGSIYSIKYPSGWLYTDKPTNSQCPDEDLVFFAPNKDQLGICGSSFGGLIGIGKTATGDDLTKIVGRYDPSIYGDFTKTNVTVAGKKAVKITGTTKVSGEADSVKLGTKIIDYVVDLNTQTLVLNYGQDPTWDDNSKTFEEMVLTLKFL